MVTTSARAAHAAMMWLLKLPFVLYWLPFLRCLFDGASYEWGNSLFGYGFSGAGTGGDFWFPVLGVALGIVLLWSGWRGPDRVFRPLGLVVVGLWFGDAVHTIASGNDMVFEGATLGVSLSIGRIALAYYTILLGLMLWSLRHPARDALPLGGLNKALLLVVLLLLPMQYFLLSTGQGREASDQTGVIITICQWLLLSAAFGVGSLGRRA